MAEMQQRYTPTGSEVATQGRPAGDGGGGSMIDALLPLLSKKLARQEQIAQMEGNLKKDALRKAGKPSPLGAVRAPRTTGGEGGERSDRAPSIGTAEGADPIGLQVKQAQQVAEIERLNAMSGRAPVKFTHGGPGMLGGYTLDPLSMNAYQRQAFLPQEAEGRESIRDRERAQQEFEREEYDKDRAERKSARDKKQASMDWYGQEARRVRAERALGFGGY